MCRHGLLFFLSGEAASSHDFSLWTLALDSSAGISRDSSERKMRPSTRQYGRAGATRLRDGGMVVLTARPHTPPKGD